MAVSSPQPIALPASSPTHDYSMGSYSAADGAAFNPASYTRHFVGSPISWRAASFGARFPQGSPTAQLLGSLDPADFRCAKMSSSVDSDRGSLINAFNVFDREGELCRNYTCCGLHLPDLHALLEHFEEIHILVVDPKAPAQIQVPFNPQCHPEHPTPFDSDDMELELDLDNSTHPSTTPSSSRSSPSSGAPSPPHTPISSYPSPTTAADAAANLAFLPPHSHYAPPHHQQQYTHYHAATPYSSTHTSRGASPYSSQPPSPGSQNNATNNSASNGCNNMVPHIMQHHLTHGHYGPSVVGGSGSGANVNVLTHPEEAFNAYARFAADYSSCMPGTQFNGSGGEEIVVGQQGGDYGQYLGHMGVGVAVGQQAQTQQCIPPALLFGDGESTKGTKLRLKVRGGAASSASSSTCTPSSSSDLTTSASSSAATSGTSTATNTPPPTPSHPPTPTSSLLLSKPFRCPKPNCNKSYKQANGLKYHMTHGSCNFAPPKDLEHVKDLLERKRREREAGGNVNGAGGGTGAALARSASLGSIGNTTGDASSTLANGNGTSTMTTTGAAATTNSNGEPFLSPAPHSAYGDLGSITETELREVEREAERRVRPFACGVGDCQRRYKNMNGLRYHYQHSGDHGAVGLALLAGGLHGCLSGGGGSNGSGSGGEGVAKAKAKQGLLGTGLGMGLGMGAEEREGRRRVLQRASVRGGSASVPVSRAGSVANVSRAGTPNGAGASVLGYGGGNVYGTNANTSSNNGSPRANNITTGNNVPAISAATATAVTAAATATYGQQHGQAAYTTSPPLTPITAAVQGLGLVQPQAQGQGQTRSQPHSPTGQHSFAQQQQQQQQQQHAQQLAYQAQFAELQRRHYMQAQAQMQAAQMQQQMQQQHKQQQELVDAQAQQEFVETQQMHAAHAQAQFEQQFEQFGGGGGGGGHYPPQEQFGRDVTMA